jgi:carbamate kinase
LNEDKKMNKKELLVIALGGNALLQRGEALEYSTMQKNIDKVSKIISKIAKDYRIVIVHGNGPQVGLLALQTNAYKDVQPYPFDVLNAESQGMIGYPLQQMLQNYIKHVPIVTLVTQVLVDQKDPAFALPTKFIGPTYDEKDSKDLHDNYDWTMKAVGKFYRRVVPSPKPIDIIEKEPILTLVNSDMVVITGGGGGIPCIRDGDMLKGAEAVVDKDYTAALLAKKLKADRLVILTDVDAVYDKFSTEESKAIRETTPNELKSYNFPAGSMGPKVEAACDFVSSTKKIASIGSLDKLLDILDGKSGTLIK